MDLLGSCLVLFDIFAVVTFLLLLYANNNQAGGSEESTATGNVQVNYLIFDVDDFLDQM